MSETKLQYQQRMQRKFERQSEDLTRLTNELHQARRAFNEEFQRAERSEAEIARLTAKNAELMAQVPELSATNAELAKQVKDWTEKFDELSGWYADALAAETELARRDAMEPVAYISESNLNLLSRGHKSVYVKSDAVMVRPFPLFTAASAPLTVWYGSMPESNGKSNWTAILHRKGQCISDGITVDRSEYPDRVRYSADEMRYLIGEITQKPDILAYDANKHSGYVKPAAPAPVVSKPTLLAMIRAWNRAEFPSEAVFEEMRQILKGGAE